LHVVLHFQSSALSFTVFISFAMSPLPLNMPSLNGCIPRSGLVLPVCVAQPDGVALSPSPNACRARCFRGTPPRTPQTKTKMMVVRTSAPCSQKEYGRGSYGHRGQRNGLPWIPRQRGLRLNVEGGLPNNRSKMSKYSMVSGEAAN